MMLLSGGQKWCSAGAGGWRPCCSQKAHAGKEAGCAGKWGSAAARGERRAAHADRLPVPASSPSYAHYYQIWDHR